MSCHVAVLNLQFSSERKFFFLKSVVEFTALHRIWIAAKVMCSNLPDSHLLYSLAKRKDYKFFQKIKKNLIIGLFAVLRQSMITSDAQLRGLVLAQPNSGE